MHAKADEELVTELEHTSLAYSMGMFSFAEGRGMGRMVELWSG